ncbi:uncharacterized protein BYT42DRAFT_557978 [Radiomyces spectabilis]|uniref:uncharacterized protein n=1 Tax=Radiomyces spectabilis TaxID=64574 RepID=UPI00222015A3|nr:uncharacterized protein BYT42DRAFT_557978 [Radiomyces spectabilis]KAI8391755.1 hypothetical protein BYT42DRAFT_557978 [Radiomyces spectabilis]
MSSYSNLRNPLLPSPPQGSRTFKDLSSASTASFRQFFNRPFRNLSTTGSQLRLAPTKRVVPSISVDGHRKQLSKRPQTVTPNTTVTQDPIIHYNGPVETLDQLPEEKLAWIKHESSLDTVTLRHPLTHCDRPIVFCKPHQRNRTFPTALCSMPTRQMKPKAMFYMRVLQIINQSSSKPCVYRCSLQLEEEISFGTHVMSEKSGKSSTEANLDETFLFDVENTTVASLRLYVQPRTTLGRLTSKFRAQEVCVGKEDVAVHLQPSDKQVQRFTLRGSEAGETRIYQVVAIVGTFVSDRAQTLLESRRIFAGFLTVYVRGKYIPRWDRYHAVLYGTKLCLYDFEYKETRRCLHTIPLQHFYDVFHPAMDDDERQVDVGSFGLALQFSEKAVGMQTVTEGNFEYRIYVLPDNVQSSESWEVAFTYAASLLEEFRIETDDDVHPLPSMHEEIEHDNNDQYYSHDKNHHGPSLVPAKFMW